DGKILVGGNFQKFNGKNFKNLVRLFPDGNLDSTFNTSNGIQGFVNKIKPLSNGKVFIVGNFTQINSKQFNRVARLNDNGSADTTFNPALFTSYPSISGANLDVYDIIILEDNKIIIGGKFSKYNNISRNGIVRINSDGSIDNNFLIGTGIHFTNGGIKALSIQEDGKILAGGLFDKYNNFQQSGIIRINNQTTSTGISTIMSSSKLNIYPNPTTGKVYIQSDKNNEIESIVIRNSIGQEIYTNKHITENSNEIELVGKSGIYYVEIISGNQKITKKLIKK
ncbi:MAG: T9SS type A sorting domain-containing protein, partial [Bacteroidia bacterium]|nr:T9SS type A sorting domain-containing protein [Bacteroidia bacterium]